MPNPKRQTIEYKMLGDTPDYSGVIFVDEKDRKLSLITGLNYWNYKYDPKKAPAYILKWLQNNGYTELVLKHRGVINNVVNRLNPSIHSLMRMVDCGWILSDSESKKISDELTLLIREEELSKKAVVSVEVYADETNNFGLKKPLVDIVTNLEKANDSNWLTDGRLPNAEEFEYLLDDIKAVGTTKQEYKNFFKLVQYRIAVNKRNKNAPKEALNAAPKPKRTYTRRKPTKAQLNAVSNAIKKGADSNTIPVKQIEKLKYQASDKDLGVESVNPLKIVGAKHLLLINTKYKRATLLIGGPMTVKGTTVYGFDKAVSVSRAIRKMSEFVNMALSSTFPQIKKEWKNLKTVESVGKGRVGEDTIILKVG